MLAPHDENPVKFVVIRSRFGVAVVCARDRGSRLQCLHLKIVYAICIRCQRAFAHQCQLELNYLIKNTFYILVARG
jgi:hypothetical protein